MWWYSNGWWWWWIAFIILFFLLPLGYGWGYRGWGPWYRRRQSPDIGHDNLAAGGQAPIDRETDTGWGWVGWFLWLILIIALIWLIAAWGWGGHWGGRGY